MGFQSKALLFRSQDFLFIAFQLFGNVTLSAYQGLFSDPLFGNLIFMGVSNFYIIPEYVVISRFSGW